MNSAESFEAEDPPLNVTPRKIVHIDMDAFYASVEQRDNPELRGKAVVVAWLGNRSVVCAASYEARQYGIRSAMPALTAKRLCSGAVFVAPDFARYKAVSQAIRKIFAQYTDLIEPLSLDEAYLDVSSNKLNIATATRVARTIREQIREELGLTASAGVAPNKFLAKIASDWKKPNGQFVIQPHEVQGFLCSLPVGRIPGVGKVTEAQMKSIGVMCVGDLYSMEVSSLLGHFGAYGRRLYELARGIDHSPVVANRASKSISAEDTFETDVRLGETAPVIHKLAAKVWNASRQNACMARTIVLKLKTRQFATLTRSFTPPMMPESVEEFTRVAVSLRERVDLEPDQLYRLIGVGLSNFRADIEYAPPLFADLPPDEPADVDASNGKHYD